MKTNFLTPDAVVYRCAACCWRCRSCAGAPTRCWSSGRSSSHPARWACTGPFCPRWPVSWPPSSMPPWSGSPYPGSRQLPGQRVDYCPFGRGRNHRGIITVYVEVQSSVHKTLIGTVVRMYRDICIAYYASTCCRAGTSINKQGIRDVRYDLIQNINNQL